MGLVEGVRVRGERWEVGVGDVDGSGGGVGWFGVAGWVWGCHRPQPECPAGPHNAHIGVKACPQEDIEFSVCCPSFFLIFWGPGWSSR